MDNRHCTNLSVNSNSLPGPGQPGRKHCEPQEPLQLLHLKAVCRNNLLLFADFSQQTKCPVGMQSCRAGQQEGTANQANRSSVCIG